MDPQLMLSRLKALLSSLHPAQLASLVAAFLLVVGIVVGSAWWMNAPTMAPLFVDLEPDAAADVVARLKALKVTYQLDDGGRTVRVPHERVDELRLDLMSRGMLSSGRPGLELFDHPAFGATEFQEKVNYRRAIEGELARTISSIGDVASARVHINIGKEELFGPPRPSTASVMLKMRGSRRLSGATVDGISNLVAFSVEGLRPEAVVILDGAGRPLTRATIEEDMPGGAGQIEAQQTHERKIAADVVALLEPVVGKDRVRVNVAVKMNRAKVEQTEDRYDPAIVMRSRQVMSDSTSTVMAPAALAGARGNAVPAQPDPKNPPPSPPPATQQASAAPGSTGAARSTEIINYEVGHTTVVTERPAGDVARLSVAVLVDDAQEATKGTSGETQLARKPRQTQDLEAIQKLVVAAVGLDPDRGDQITVQNMSFDQPLVDDVPPPTMMQQVWHYTPQIWEGARMLIVGLVGVAALLFFVRPLMQRVGGLPAVRPVGAAAGMATAGQPLRTVAELEHEIEAQLDAAVAPKIDSRRLPVLARRASAVTAKEPENVAKLLRSWINEGER
jgi:flagellar M-ring protein FliF